MKINVKMMKNNGGLGGKHSDFVRELNEQENEQSKNVQGKIEKF